MYGRGWIRSSTKWRLRMRLSFRKLKRERHS
jgi:hypothetical protein